MSDIPTSGMISLNQMHTEAGGTSGTACTINDADIRGLIGATSGAAMDFADWYGASSSLDTQTVTVGHQASGYNQPEVWGFHSGTIGSISDGTFNVKSGSAITRLQWSQNQVLFDVTGTHANSGFTTMTIAGTAYARSSASHLQFSGTTRWTWSSTTNPFGTTANATKSAVFT